MTGKWMKKLEQFNQGEAQMFLISLKADLASSAARADQGILGLSSEELMKLLTV